MKQYSKKCVKFFELVIFLYNRTIRDNFENSLSLLNFIKITILALRNITRNSRSHFEKHRIIRKKFQTKLFLRMKSYFYRHSFRTHVVCRNQLYSLERIRSLVKCGEKQEKRKTKSYERATRRTTTTAERKGREYF